MLALSLAVLLLLGRIAGDSLYDIPPTKLEKLGSGTLIVCLAGGKGRVQAALSMYAEGKGLALFVAGAGPRTSREALIREHLTNEIAEKLLDSRRQNIVVETQSRNTIENAYAVSRFLRVNPEITDIILITSAYHMRRSQLIFETAIGRSVGIHPVAAKESTYSLETWSESLLGITLTLEESFKLWLARLFIPMLELF